MKYFGRWRKQRSRCYNRYSIMFNDCRVAESILYDKYEASWRYVVAIEKMKEGKMFFELGFVMYFKDTSKVFYEDESSRFIYSREESINKLKELVPREVFDRLVINDISELPRRVKNELFKELYSF